jgi:hypothetical protein
MHDATLITHFVRVVCLGSKPIQRVVWHKAKTGTWMKWEYMVYSAVVQVMSETQTASSKNAAKYKSIWTSIHCCILVANKSRNAFDVCWRELGDYFHAENRCTATKERRDENVLSFIGIVGEFVII